MRTSSFLEFGLNIKKPEQLKIQNLLRFQDLIKESSYQSSQKILRLHYTRSIIIFYIVLSVLTTIFHPLDKEENRTAYLLLTIINILVLIILFLIIKIKKPRIHLQIIMTLLQVFISINWVELSIRRENPRDNSMNLISGLFLELVTIGPALAECSPIFSIISSLIPSIYFIARLLKHEENNQFTGLTACIIILNSIFVTIWSVIKENHNRQKYLRQKENEMMLKQFEEIIKDVIPSAIIVCKQDNIVFFNEETSKLLQINSKYELEKRLREILIEERPLNEGKNMTKKIHYEPINLKTESEILNLYDFIRMNTRIPKTEKKLSAYSGTLDPLVDINLSENLPKHFDIKIESLSWEGVESHLIVLTEDRTTEQLDFLTKVSQNKDDMLATVSHDLRSPLNAIIGIIETVLEEINGDELKKSLEIALGSSKLLLFIINDILDFSQIQHGKLRIQPTAFDVVETIRETTKLMKPQAKRKGINLEFFNNFRLSKQPILYNDPNRLRQIVLNLMSNALKFTEKGSIKICVGPSDDEQEEFAPDAKEFSSVKISVQDTGCGIKEEDLPKMFSKFGKLDDSKRMNTQGVGLGLEISQSLVKEMNLNIPGEEIKLLSEYGKGTLFYFNLHSMPFEEIEKNKRKYTGSNKHIKEMSQFIFGTIEEYSDELTIPRFKTNNLINEKFGLESASSRILLVDDDQINLMVLKTYLKNNPEFQYDCAFNGKQAVEAVLDGASKGIYYDIILMDFNMPVMNGLDAAEKIFALEKEKKIPKVCVVALTADNSEREQQRCKNIGMTDYLTKPIKKVELIKNLKKFAERLHAGEK